MAVPADADTVTYRASFYNGDTEHPGEPHIEIDMAYESALPAAAEHAAMRELLDQALAAAFLAFRDTVKAAYPNVPGRLSRSYSGPLTGDPFPPTT